MEEIRETLIAKIDTVVTELFEQQNGEPEIQLQIDATVIGKDTSRRGNTNRKRKIVLGTFEIGTWNTPNQSPIVHRTTEEDANSSTITDPDRQAVNVILNGPEGSTSSPPDPATNDCWPRRKTVGGLRMGAIEITPPRTPSPLGSRQLATDQRNFPKRRKIEEGPAKLQPSTVDKLIEGIWEQIHKPNLLLVPTEIGNTFSNPSSNASLDFADVSRRCRDLTGVSRITRSIEVMMQAHWVDCYNARVDVLHEQRPDLRPHEQKKLVMSEACTAFQWSAKELRNRMAIWKGYREIKDAAGWAALTFAGPGIYRFCKYRMGFDQDAISKLRSLQSRFEVAADTIQPQWRHTLTLVGVSTQRVYRGHPHDWVVGRRKDPVPLPWTYRQWDQNFSYTHIDNCIVDPEAFGSFDPRRIAHGHHFICSLCAKPQSDTPEKNECECFADLFGPNARSLAPVQIFSTDDGRNNGLIACCSFDRGAPIGEFVGVVTKDLENLDVMHGQGANGVTYQIWQGQSGNFTKFINHSCAPNSQFQLFVWLGLQRTIVVSKGVAAGQEVTVDYSDRYWQTLQKKCLCKQAGCRYKDRTDRQ